MGALISLFFLFFTFQLIYKSSSAVQFTGMSFFNKFLYVSGNGKIVKINTAEENIGSKHFDDFELVLHGEAVQIKVYDRSLQNG